MQITKEEALKAIRTILLYIGENPDREGLISTPERVIKSYNELFSGYNKDIGKILNTKFLDIANFEDIILLKNISFNSMCEHHILPIVGMANIAYIPNKHVIGISKIIRVVDSFAKRLQIQEKMTANICKELQEYIKPKGVAVHLQASHYCMIMRGVEKENILMDTFHYTGLFQQESQQQKFINLIK